MRENGAVRAIMTTTGRKTGRDHPVRLLAVIHDEKVYFSRHKPDSDWYKNALKNPTVRVRLDNHTFAGMAREITNEGLTRRISEIKYPGQPRAAERRVVIEVTPCE